MKVGITVGQLVAGFAGPAYGWRMPFVIVSLPAVLLTLISWWVIKEPERGCVEEGLAQRFDQKEDYHYKVCLTLIGLLMN